MSELPFRCSVCGLIVAPDSARAWEPEDRYAWGTCTHCHARRELVRADSVREATEGYQQQLERARRAREARLAPGQQQVK